MIWFANDVKLTNQQTSALLHVTTRLLANLSEGGQSAVENAASFAEMLEGHSSNDNETDADGKQYDFPASCKERVENFVISGFVHPSLPFHCTSPSRERPLGVAETLLDELRELFFVAGSSSTTPCTNFYFMESSPWPLKWSTSH